MTIELILKKFKDQPIISLNQLKDEWEDIGYQPNSLGVTISRALKKSHLLQLKRGYYVTADYLNSHDIENYKLYLANLLQKGSYVSLQTALAYYGLTTEYTKNITSISPKGTYNYKNNIGEYKYRNIKRDKYLGFKIEKIGEYEILIAEKYKAIFDYLYLNVNIEAFRSYEIKVILDEYRISYDDLSDEELLKLKELIDNHVNN